MVSEAGEDIPARRQREDHGESWELFTQRCRPVKSEPARPPKRESVRQVVGAREGA